MASAIDNTYAEHRVWPDLTHSYGPHVETFLKREMGRCYIAVSPGTRYVNTARLRALLEWTCCHATEVVVLEGCYPQRWNKVALQRLTYHEAEKDAHACADSLQRRIGHILTLADLKSCSVVDWASIVLTDCFKEDHAVLTDFYNRTPAFQSAIDVEVLSFARRRRLHKESLTHQIKRMLCEYVIEEIAVFHWLHQKGYQLEIYPGEELFPMRLIVDGEFDRFPLNFECRSQVSIRLS
jgi:tRNA-dependent cyclodipeptide synthase